MIASLGLASEMLAMRGLSEVTDHGAFLVQRTPGEPDYWSGNQILLRDPAQDAGRALGWFEAAFPDATHRAFVWDLPGLAAVAPDPGFAQAGCAPDLCDVLSLTGPLAGADLPEGFAVRALAGAEDWAASLALAIEMGREDGHDGPQHAAYLRRRLEARRGQIAAGQGAWFGVFDGDLLVAQMGMLHDDRIARYQDVQTRARHRRRGLCAALLRHAGLWALGRAPQAVPVIIAQADGDAGRLYRRMGFALTERLTGVLRPGYGPDTGTG